MSCGPEGEDDLMQGRAEGKRTWTEFSFLGPPAPLLAAASPGGFSESRRGNC
jgi:hypothetical protein